MSSPTLDDLNTLPPTLDLMTAARMLGIGRTKAYELARNGEFPCHIIRVGELYRVSTADLLRVLRLPPMTGDRRTEPDLNDHGRLAAFNPTVKSRSNEQKADRDPSRSAF